MAAWLTWLAKGCLPAFPAIGLLLGGPIMGAPPGQESPRAPAAPARPAPPSSAPAKPLSLDDSPEAFVPKTPPTEADADRLHALTLFSTARALEKREQFPAALRHYERALRYDPAAKTVARQIVVLAEQLDRPAERNRYLLRLAQLDPEAVDPGELIDLTDDVDQQEVLRRVIAVFEKILAARAEKKPEKSPVDVLLPWRLAEMYVVDEQYPKAAECARRVLDALKEPLQFGLDEEMTRQLVAGPRPPQSLFGEYFLLADRPDDAEAAFREADRLAPNPALLSFHLARVEARRKRPEAALTYLEAAFEQGLTARGLEPYELLAEVLGQLDKKGELVARLEKLLAKNPEDVGLGYFLAGQYRQAGQFDQARPLYVRLLAQQPAAVGYAGLAEVYRKTDRPEELLRLLGDAVGKTASLEPLGDEAQAIAGDAALLDKLVATAKAALAKDPASLGPHAPLGAALLARDAKRGDVAAEFFEWALRQAPDEKTDVLLLWGGGLLAEKRLPEAAAVFRRGTDEKLSAEDRATFYYYLCTTLEMDGRTDEALDAARNATDLQKDSPRPPSQIAWVLYHAKRNAEARDAYRALIDKFEPDQTTPGVREILRDARLVLAALHVIEGRPTEAEERLEQVLDEFPDDVSAMNDLGYLWADENQHPQRALAMVRRAVEAEPDNAAYRDSLGWALFRLGRLDEAAAELQTAAAAGPEGEILEHLGEVFAAMKKTDHAEDTWRKAAEAYRKAGQSDRAAKVDTRLQELKKTM